MSDSDKIKEEVQEEKDAFYGDETLGSGSPRPDVDDDTAEAVEAVVGNEPKQGEPFSIADEVKKDEDARRGKRNPKNKD